ncbi:MAG: hypothetical protein FWH20_11135 [Oscillospiraceae bacterium]|nr:hypothetical protein [Oscillospiraceae bacterium]
MNTNNELIPVAGHDPSKYGRRSTWSDCDYNSAPDIEVDCVEIVKTRFDDMVKRR